ncbi:glycosyl transferase [Cloacibacterium rupense]|uniref:Glycosyl transferase n=1 Tax=Cloacibacterium rupense TaxID=517423 RepID=A0ABQ2NPQ7_9FLAO|nr:glycosyltransferase [Cloacibacterium rupense]GGP06601.1 glycosyl transferase [Cloacibacterium rupense]
MKKKILFVLNSLRVGGAEKALISLLHELDYERFEVDLFLFTHDGGFLERLPKQVNLLPSPENFKFFDMSTKSAIFQNLKKGNLSLAIDRYQFSKLLNVEKNDAVAEQKAWKFLKNHIENLNQEYDLAFSFLEKIPNYFIIDKVKARKKILTVMTDYQILGMKKEIDVPYFEKANKIFVLSEENKVSLQQVFPEFKDKIIIIENMISEKEVLSLSEEQITDFPENVFTMVSVGRLVEGKIHEIGVEVMKLLENKDLHFKWFVLGEGNRRKLIESKIKAYHLENYITLLGEKDNPYPYIKKADVFLHLSQFEGYGIAIAEARILKKCIVLNDFTTAAAHIKNGFDGVIAPLNPEKIADEIEKLMLDENLRKKYEQNVSFDKDFAQRILRKIDDIIEN